jgi:hypothetical protein
MGKREYISKKKTKREFAQTMKQVVQELNNQKPQKVVKGRSQDFVLHLKEVFME